MRLFLTLLALLAPPLASAALAEHRTKVHLLPFSNIARAEMMDHYLEFGGVISRKMGLIPGELSSVNEMNVEIVENLELCAHAQLFPLSNCQFDSNPASKNKRGEYWQVVDGVLGLISGIVDPSDRNQLIIRADFFWGNLRGSYPDTQISLEVPIDANHYDGTRDAVSIATMYALANYLSRDCENNVDFHRVMAVARENADALAGDLPNMGTRLVSLIDEQSDA
ncbi:MAG: hypothetical protein ACR2RE_08510, partial [Geminicoccaceae bacterium]